MRNIADSLTLALPAAVASQEDKIICVMETARPASSYWLDWGGTYDMPDTSQVLLFFDGFLDRVEGTRVYIHLPRYPWTYSLEHTQRETP